MKETLKVTSALCGILAIISLITGIRVITGNGLFIGIAFFSMTRSGTVMGFFGNIISMALTVIGFGTMAYCGFAIKKNPTFRKKAFIWGLIMSAICILSLIVSIFGKSFNFGDIILLALPLVYTYAIFRSV
ncbi:MAG: hypothetical protein LUI05_08655 [Oscillospiraceae bacterium]|nr:hypothetical protein [Oscillospiraceae bacterium]